MESRAVKNIPSNSSSLSPSFIHFLSTTFKSKSNLLKSEQLVQDLRSDCLSLDASISNLSRRLVDSIMEYGSHSYQVKVCIVDVKNGLRDLKSPAPAKEVARVETVRAYAGGFRQLTEVGNSGMEYGPSDSSGLQSISSVTIMYKF